MCRILPGPVDDKQADAAEVEPDHNVSDRESRCRSVEFRPACGHRKGRGG
jgi:hypothetical protein